MEELPSVLSRTPIESALRVTRTLFYLAPTYEGAAPLTLATPRDLIYILGEDKIHPL